jgi:beta propeller domain-containing protein
MRVRATLAVGVAAVVAGLAPAAGASSPRRAAPAATRAFPSCAALTDYGRRALMLTNGGTGVPVRAVSTPPVVLGPRPQRPPLPDGAPVPVSAAAPQAAAGVEAFSNTNVQEADVDESDVAKSDGRRLFLLASGSLLAIDVRGDVPRVVGSLPVGNGARELLLRGDRLLLLGSRLIGGPGWVSLQAELTEVDVSDPAAMRVARTLAVPGSYISARLTGGTARIVLTTPPGADEAVARMPRGAAPPGLRTFVPHTRLRSRITRRTFRRPLAACRQVRRTAAFSGLDLLTILTVDLDRGLYDVDRDAVMAGAQVVYASGRSLYVASQRFVRALPGFDGVPSGVTTEIHRFDASEPGRTTYAASGSVDGFVLNQYALSEHAGALRVATTRTPPWLPDAPRAEGDSAVTALREQDGRLTAVGQVGGLGRGEQIYAVRFIGATGYVVTFRQVDPLYVLDLSDPRRPKLAGELKIPGYSAYLHPLGDNLLLGIGQDASEQGAVRGAQVSVFDVSDPARPRRLHQHPLGTRGSQSGVEFDPHAFLWWAPERTAVVPVRQYAPGGGTSAAVGLRVRRAEGIEEIGRVSHGDGPYPDPVQRSFVVGRRLFTVSERGVASSRLANFAPLGFLAFPERPPDVAPPGPAPPAVP